MMFSVSILTVLLVMVCQMGSIYAADILEGYLVAKGDTNCLKFKADDSGPEAGTIANTAEATLAAACTKVKLTDAMGGGYLIVGVADGTKQVTLPDTNQGTAATLTNAGTALKFVTGATTHTGVTAGSPNVLTNSAAPFLIDGQDGDGDGSDCLKHDFVFTSTDPTTTCADITWYFIIDCTDPQCTACVGGNAECTACSAMYALKADKTCTACSDIDDCSACSYSDTTLQCTTCTTTGRTPSSDNTACAHDCASSVADCAECLNAAATCTTCNAGYHLDGTCKACNVENCVDCAADIDECSACSDGYNLQGDTACEAENGGIQLRQSILLLVLIVLNAVRKIN